MERLPIATLSLNHLYFYAHNPLFITSSIINMVLMHEKWRLISTLGNYTIRVDLNDGHNTIVELYIYIENSRQKLFLIEQCRHRGCAFKAYDFFRNVERLLTYELHTSNL